MPVWGAVPSKIVLHAGLLITAGRIDLDRIRVAIDPSSPISTVNAKTASKLGLSSDTQGEQDVVRDRELGLGTHAVHLRHVRVGQTPDADMTVGNDVLRRMLLTVDFRDYRVRTSEWRDLGQITRHLKPLHATVTDDGCLTIDAADGSGQPLRVALVGGEVGNGTSTQRINLGPLAADAAPTQRRCTASQAIIGWSALRGHRLVFDLKDEKIWID